MAVSVKLQKEWGGFSERLADDGPSVALFRVKSSREVSTSRLDTEVDWTGLKVLILSAFSDDFHGLRSDPEFDVMRQPKDLLSANVDAHLI
jgi:hypothetical protein